MIKFLSEDIEELIRIKFPRSALKRKYKRNLVSFIFDPNQCSDLFGPDPAPYGNLKSFRQQNNRKNPYRSLRETTNSIPRLISNEKNKKTFIFFFRDSNQSNIGITVNCSLRNKRYQNGIICNRDRSSLCVLLSRDRFIKRCRRNLHPGNVVN